MRTFSVLLGILFGIILGKVVALLVIGIPIMMISLSLRYSSGIFYWIEALLSFFFVYWGIRLGMKVTSGKSFKINKNVAMAWAVVIAFTIILMIIMSQSLFSKGINWNYVLANGISFIAAGIIGVNHQLKGRKPNVEKQMKRI